MNKDVQKTAAFADNVERWESVAVGAFMGGDFGFTIWAEIKVSG